MPNHSQPYVTFLRQRIRREMAELYAHTTIRSLGVAMVSLYEPLYFYKLGFSIKQIVGFYMIAVVAYFFVLPIGGKIAVKYGFEHAMFYSVPFRIGYYLMLYFIALYPVLAIPAALLWGIERCIYWPAHHANLAFYSSKKTRGKQIGGFRIIGFIVATAGPILGGLILKLSNFPTLFVAVSILFFISIVPLFTTKEQFTPGQFSYKRAFKRLFRKDNRRFFIGYWGFGETMVALVIWPIFLFQILDKYLSLGVVISLSTLFTIIVTLIISRYTDSKHRNKLIKIGTVGNFLIWYARMFVRGPITIFTTDTLYRIAGSSFMIPIYYQTYNYASKTHRYMKTIIFYEQSINVGKFIMLLLIIGVLYITPHLEFTFIPAAFMSLLYALF